MDTPISHFWIGTIPTMFESIVITIVPVAFVVLLGYVAGSRNSFKVADRALLTKLVLTWLLPPLLLAGILRTPRAALLDYKIPLMFLIGLMVPYLAMLLVCRFALRYDQRTAALKASLLAFPDMVFMGIPVLGALFGPSSLFPILIANLVPALIILPLTSVLLETGSDKSKSSGNQVFVKTLARAVCEPRVWAPFIGAVLVILNVRMPTVAITSLDLIGEATTGLSLFVVGLIIAEEKIKVTGAVTFDVVFKNLLHPAAMLLTVRLFGVTGVLAREAVLLAAIPSAVLTTMFAEQYGVLVSESSTTILATRVLSFATIPIVFMLTRSL
jgi:malonate transporter and related proteins